jgi:hypothetical protein
MNYELDVKINEDALDIECLEQPNLMRKYSIHLEKMILKRDQQKELLDLIKADLDLDIRTNPDKYVGDIKVTESVVAGAILRDKKYQKANQDYLEAKYEAGVAKGVIEAIYARKSMLEILVKLHGQNYFAGPSVPRDLTKERENFTKETHTTNQNIARSLKRKQ